MNEFICDHQNYNKMYSTDLNDTQWQFIKKSIHIEERKRKYAMR